MTKVVGILGGMGPLATVKLFEDMVLLTEAKKDQEHLHILVDNNTKIPDRTDYILGEMGYDPRPKLIESAKRLEAAGAEFLVMPCNTAHNFYDDIVKNINIPFLNMIEETAKYIKEKYPEDKNIGLLATDGTIKAQVYNKIFRKYDLEIITPSAENQKYVYQLIYNIKKDVKQDSLEGFYKAMDDIKDREVNLFIAGCTEISVALDLYKLKGNFVDPLRVVAISAIEFAGGRVK